MEQEVVRRGENRRSRVGSSHVVGSLPVSPASPDETRASASAHGFTLRLIGWAIGLDRLLLALNPSDVAGM
jgi:hypothetical protein